MEVIDVHKANLNNLGYSDLFEWLKNPNHLYIGRHMVYVKGAEKSKWHNPYAVKKYGLDECLRKYREYLLNTPELYEHLDELQGKVLGCWCKYPNSNPCHGDILVELVKSTFESENKEE